jgi:hypothetical protein
MKKTFRNIVSAITNRKASGRNTAFQRVKGSPCGGRGVPGIISIPLPCEEGARGWLARISTFSSLFAQTLA